MRTNRKFARKFSDAEPGTNAFPPSHPVPPAGNFSPVSVPLCFLAATMPSVAIASLATRHCLIQPGTPGDPLRIVIVSDQRERRTSPMLSQPGTRVRTEIAVTYRKQKTGLLPARYTFAGVWCTEILRLLDAALEWQHDG